MTFPPTADERAKWLFIDGWIRALPVNTLTTVLTSIVTTLFRDFDNNGLYWDPDKSLDCADAVSDIVTALDEHELVPPTVIRC